MISKKASRSSAKKEEQTSTPKQATETAQGLRQVKLNIVLFYQERDDSQIEMLPDLTLYINLRDEIDVNELVNSLRKQSFLNQDCCLAYQDAERGVYIHCADTTSMGEAKNIPLHTINQEKQQLKLKVRRNKKSLVENLLEEQRKTAEAGGLQQKGIKQKEKLVGEVVQKVALWRRFYTGFYDEKGTFIQKPLEQAANEVGIAKKTLDDYLLQIRCGKKYGFNFNQNVKAKIGELRAFVRDAKKNEKKEGN